MLLTRYLGLVNKFSNVKKPVKAASPNMIVDIKYY